MAISKILGGLQPPPPPSSPMGRTPMGTVDSRACSYYYVGLHVPVGCSPLQCCLGHVGNCSSLWCFSQVFYWTHQFCIIFWLLLFFHSPTFYLWFVLPGLVYVVERVLRLQMYRRARFGITYIQAGYILPANVRAMSIHGDGWGGASGPNLNFCGPLGRLSCGAPIIIMYINFYGSDQAEFRSKWT